MNVLLVLFGGRLAAEAFQPVSADGASSGGANSGANSVSLALTRARSIPGVAKTVLLLDASPLADGAAGLPLAGVQVESRPSWTKKSLLDTLSRAGAGFDLTCFAWADCPFLDPALAGKLADRHLRYAADYSYADGWPYGLAPELLSPGTAGILLKIAGDEDGPVERDTLFSVLQKDINAFDIETEISPVDLRCHRLNLCADSKRNLLLLRRFAQAAGGAVPDTEAVERIIAEQPEILRTLPAFFPVQVFGGCPQSCAICPYPAASRAAGCGEVTARRDFMEAGQFESLLKKIVDFSGDAVIDLSLWGEISLHPQKMALIEAALSRPELALVLETSGIGWKTGELEQCAALAQKAAAVRKNPLPPLSWIVSLDAADPARYLETRGAGFSEAVECAKKLFALFPENAYVQAVRTAGAEDDIERFYRSWKEAAPSKDAVIIQKHDDFCGELPKKQASDLSPVIRNPCWHIMRDMPVLLDGTVPLCREDISLLKKNAGGGLGNAFSDSLETIWERGNTYYTEQCGEKYAGSCAGCDEYYTYNF